MNELLTLLRRQLADDLRAAPGLLGPGGMRERRLRRCRNIADLRDSARRALPRAVFDFVDGAACDEVTARANESDFGDWALRPRVLVDVSEPQLSTALLGQRVSLPLVGAPTGLTGLVHHEGELGVARAVHAAGSVYVLSAMASYTIEEIAEGTTGPTWLQVYPWRDRGLVAELVERARHAGLGALVLTVDVPRAGARERDLRNGFGVPPRATARTLAEGALRPRWALDFVRRPRINVANAGARAAEDPVSLTEYINRQFDSGATWQVLAWLRESWQGPLVVKGVLHPADAAQAARLGADAVAVSNHGGRQLDRACSSIAALPAVLDALGGEAEVLLDGGVRRGSDLAIALALGARACMAGRPLLYGLAAGGREGAARAVEILRAELSLCLALLGCPEVGRLDRSWLLDAAARESSL